MTPNELRKWSELLNATSVVDLGRLSDVLAQAADRIEELERQMREVRKEIHAMTVGPCGQSSGTMAYRSGATACLKIIDRITGSKG